MKKEQEVFLEEIELPERQPMVLVLNKETEVSIESLGEEKKNRGPFRFICTGVISPKEKS